MPKLFLLIFFLASLLFFRFVTFYQSEPVYHSGENVVLQTRLHEEPELSNKGQQFSIKTSLNQIIFVKATTSPRLHDGQLLTVSGKLQAKEMPMGDSLLTLYFPKILVKDEPLDPISHVALFIRKSSKELYESALPPTSASLLSGIVFGAKEHFTPEFKQSLSSAGVLHVIAASGMNVTFIAAALLFVLGSFIKRQRALVFGILGIIFYVFLVGFQPSIVRAAIMGLLTFSAGILGRQSLAIFAIFLTGYCMLLWDPAFLFDVGFQLSFMATLGILLLEKPLQKIVRLDKWGKAGDIFGESFTTTVAAEAATVPILLGAFGSFGILSVLVNALVLWVVPILMVLGSIAVLVGFIFLPLAKVILFFALPFLLFFEAVVSFFGGMGLNFSVESFPWQIAVGYYLVVAASIIKFRTYSVQRAIA